MTPTDIRARADHWRTQGSGYLSGAADDLEAAADALTYTAKTPTEPGHYAILWPGANNRPVVWTLERGGWISSNGRDSAAPPLGTPFFPLSRLGVL